MAANEYQFVTRWRMHASVEEVGQILGDALALPRWWPAVYLDVRQLEPGDARGIGATFDLYTKGWLPYTLRWQLRVLDLQPPHSATIEARGDFVGRGVWMFAPDGEWTDITYDWRIRAEKPLLRRLSSLLKPIFAANHEWAMRAGEESLRLELLRRRATTPAEREAIPPPPQPTGRSPLVLALALLVVCAGVYALRKLFRRGKTSHARSMRVAANEHGGFLPIPPRPRVRAWQADPRR